ncbi:MAG TPA: transposase [Candidatus Hypogeohydataceae bacterium YC38]
MTCNPDKHYRRSLRLKGYDYSQAGAYFVTICTHNQACIFGDIVNGEMRLNDYGGVVEKEWMKTASIRKNVELDVFVVMPNHFHGIVSIVNAISVGATRRVAPTLRGLISNSIGAIVGQFKSIVTKNIHKMGFRDFKWQRNYYEHVIRDEKDINEIREYIITNPLKWAMDSENPNNLL